MSHDSTLPLRPQRKVLTPWFEPGAPLLPLPVVGRPNTLTARATIHSDSVTIRLDDNRDLAFWAEVRLTEGDLIHLLEQIQQRPDDAA